MIRDIRESGRPVKVVFISAYQELSYARQAIQYGALDYIVKPVNTGQLEQVVGRAVAVIRQESEEERNKEMLKSYERKNHSITVEELLEPLTDGNKGAASTLGSPSQNQQLPEAPGLDWHRAAGKRNGGS
ncbi:response regulator [Paenibacillus graminis]|nr:response regulator [Paenibacillus graminis]